MAELEFDHLVLRYCRQIILKTMDHVRGAMRGENRLNLKRAVADPQLQKSAQNLTKAVDRDAEDLILDALQQKFSKLPGVKAYTVFAELRKRQHFDLRPWHDQGEEALREAAVQERMGKLNRQIFQTITRGERAEKSLGNVDAHNPHFIGRTANLRMLRDNFVKPGHVGVVTAVNGVGGLGKTALAIEYAHAFADEYGGGRWQVRCAGQDDLRLALDELATPIGFEFTDDEKKNADLQFERIRRELKKLADAHHRPRIRHRPSRPQENPIRMARCRGARAPSQSRTRLVVHPGLSGAAFV